MAKATQLFTRALTAYEVATGFSEIAAVIFGNENVHIDIQTSVGGIAYSADLPGSKIADSDGFKRFLQLVHGKNLVLAISGTLHHPNFGSNHGVKYVSEDGVVGALSVGMPNDPAKAIQALEQVAKLFGIVSRASLAVDALDASSARALREREIAVGDLHAALEKLATFQTELATREASRREKLQAEMDKSHRERADKLEAQYRELQAASDNKAREREEAQAKREQEFSERVAKFDTREAKYMRRDLLVQIKETLKEAEQTALSEPTVQKRRWIHGFVWLLLASSVSLAGVMVYRLLNTKDFDWHILGPLSAGIVTFVATMVYYLKWNDRWFREHADAEFSAKRYKADILRASWVAELVHEWAKEGKDDQLPPDLITAFTKNLFRDSGPSRESEHPMDHLTSLMRRATEIDVGKTGISVKAHKDER